VNFEVFLTHDSAPEDTDLQTYPPSAARLPVQKKHMCCLSSFPFLRLSAIAVNLSHRLMCYAPCLGKKAASHRGWLGAGRLPRGFLESSHIVSLNGSVNWNIMRFKGTELHGRISFEAGGNNDPTTNRGAVWLPNHILK